MTAKPKAPTPPPRMSVEEFLVWSEAQDGRYELVNGLVHGQAAQRAPHWEVKLATHVALLAAIRARGLDCHVVPDGGTVRIDDSTAYEPDAMVYCGGRAARTATVVESPVIVVEVLSPSTGRLDRGGKLAGYFRLPSVSHYLIIDAETPLVIHHRRQGDGDILTRILREGAFTLDPPGIELALSDLYASV